MCPSFRKGFSLRLRRCREHPPRSLGLPTVHWTVGLTRRATANTPNASYKQLCFSLQECSSRFGETARRSPLSCPHYSTSPSAQIKPKPRRRLVLYAKPLLARLSRPALPIPSSKECVVEPLRTCYRSKTAQVG